MSKRQNGNPPRNTLKYLAAFAPTTMYATGIEVMDLTYVDLVDISYQQQNRKDTPYIILELYNKLRSGDVER